MPNLIKKLIDNGKVAVLYSPGFGAGWSTWNRGVPDLMFEPAVVEFVEKEQWAEFTTYVTLKDPGLYTGGMDRLAVAWLPVGANFRIIEYDGSESIEIKEDIDWITA